jgi:tetratricopeptide (TPR) repeat protein
VAPTEQDLLVAKLDRYPPQRYPVQHATTQFHLGSLLLHAGQAAAAARALEPARDLFSQAGMGTEAAKATMMLGVALRMGGDLTAAHAAFGTAMTEFQSLGQVAEQAAAAYNVGLVCQDRGDAPGAHTSWSTARELFLTVHDAPRAAAASREHGSSLLATGDVAAAVAVLTAAVAMSEATDDVTGHGHGANALGLAHLAGGDPAAAVTALRTALGCFPRAVRPAEHAMVQANVALAYADAGDGSRARLAARHAVAVAEAAPAVRQQAAHLLAGSPGCAAGDLLAVLDAEDPDRWPGIVRAEVVRVVEVGVEEREGLVRGFLDGLLTRPQVCYDLAECWWQVVIELPPRGYELLVAAAARLSADRVPQDAERLSAILCSAMARLGIPQWQRLAASLNAAARAARQPETWR